MFWHVDSEKMFNVDEVMKHKEEYTDKVRQRNSSASDILLMDQAIEHMSVPFVMSRCSVWLMTFLDRLLMPTKYGAVYRCILLFFIVSMSSLHPCGKLGVP